MKKRPGMMIYFDDWAAARDLTPEQFKRLFFALYDRAQENPTEALNDDPMVAFAYKMMQRSIDRDGERYDAIVERRREAGRRGGLAKAGREDDVDDPEIVANVANASFAKQTKPTPSPSPAPTPAPIPAATPTPTPSLSQPDGDCPETALIGETEGEREIVSPMIERKLTERSGTMPPALSEVVSYGKQLSPPLDEESARSFLAEQAARGWLDSENRPIRDWKLWLSGWLIRHQAAPPGASRPLPVAMQFSQRRYTDADFAAINDIARFMEEDDSG